MARGISVGELFTGLTDSMKGNGWKRPGAGIAAGGLLGIGAAQVGGDRSGGKTTHAGLSGALHGGLVGSQFRGTRSLGNLAKSFANEYTLGGTVGGIGAGVYAAATGHNVGNSMAYGANAGFTGGMLKKGFFGGKDVAKVAEETGEAHRDVAQNVTQTAAKGAGNGEPAPAADSVRPGNPGVSEAVTPPTEQSVRAGESGLSQAVTPPTEQSVRAGESGLSQAVTQPAANNAGLSRAATGLANIGNGGFTQSAGKRGNAGLSKKAVPQGGNQLAWDFGIEAEQPRDLIGEMSSKDSQMTLDFELERAKQLELDLTGPQLSLDLGLPEAESSDVFRRNAEREFLRSKKRAKRDARRSQQNPEERPRLGGGMVVRALEPGQVVKRSPLIDEILENGDPDHLRELGKRGQFPVKHYVFESFDENPAVSRGGVDNSVGPYVLESFDKPTRTVRSPFLPVSAEEAERRRRIFSR